MMASIFDCIGNTPLIELKKINTKKEVKIFGKLEGNNPGGSVKDRAALNMIRSAMQRGEIKQGTKLIEATSGNTGIALAMVASLFDLDIELVMPENSTKERIMTMKAYGAKVTLTSSKGSMEEARDYAVNKVEKEGFFMLNQFDNPDNYMAHYFTTGPEIWRDTSESITHFISSMGTTGTIMGTSKFLKEVGTHVKIVGCQPSEGAKIPGIRRWPVEYLPKIYNPGWVDTIMDVTEEEAKEMTIKLAKNEGIFAGMSSGGAVSAALRLAQELETGVIVCIICDRGDRYLSTDLFES